MPVEMMTLGLALGLVFGVIYAVNLLLTRDASEAASRTVDRLAGVVVGTLGVVAIAIVQGMAYVAEIPGLVVAAIGMGALLQGLSLPVASATALTVWLGLAAIRGEV